MQRCEWTNASELFIDYHDKEWGVPTFDDNTHFEFLTLESAQAGLSWLTILKKREHYRKVYENFDPHKIALFNEKKQAELLADPGIVRNKLKVAASISNAQHFITIQEEFGSFSNYIWNFVNGKPVIGHWKTIHDIPVSTDLSDIIFKDLKKRGFKFLGTVIIYSHLQATGIVNDHTTDCFRYKELIKEIK